jgi:hypothetical protein
MQGIGVNIVTQASPVINAQKTELAIIYSPRLNFPLSSASSLSVGLPISLAFTGNYPDSTINNSTLGWMLDVPLLINFHYGAGSSKKMGKRFGFFAGGGVGYHTNLFTAKSVDEKDSLNGLSGIGPVVNIGWLMAVGKIGHTIELRFSFMKTGDLSKSNIFEIGYIFNF